MRTTQWSETPKVQPPPNSTTQGARPLVTMGVGGRGKQYLTLFLRTQWQTKMRFHGGSFWGTNECMRLIYGTMGEGLRAGVWATLTQPAWMMTPPWLGRWIAPLAFSHLYPLVLPRAPRLHVMQNFMQLVEKMVGSSVKVPQSSLPTPSKRQDQQLTSCKLFWSF